jgi:DNA-binding CsgD family transcriptional regulator
VLTQRDQIILDRLLEGKGYKSIGKELGISATTVGTDVRHICAKLDCPNRLVAAVKWAEIKKLK